MCGVGWGGGGFVVVTSSNSFNYPSAQLSTIITQQKSPSIFQEKIGIVKLLQQEPKSENLHIMGEPLGELFNLLNFFTSTGK